MANAVTHQDLALEKFIEIDSSEDPTTFTHLLENNNSFPAGSRPATNENTTQIVYDDRRKALFGPSSLEAALTRDEIKTQFITRFNDGKMQSRFRIAAESLKRQPDENMKRYIHRSKTLVDKGWPTPSDADANARTSLDARKPAT